MGREFYIGVATLAMVCAGEKIRFISTERPEVTYYNPKYISYVNFTSQRYGRHDPTYYVGLHINFIWPFDNNVTVDFFFYESLIIRYFRSPAIQMHFKICDLIHKDQLFGAAMKQGRLNQPCPYPPGEYHMYNMSLPEKLIPYNFPFTKGRIAANVTATDTRELIGSGHINMEIKTANTKERTEKPQ